MRPLIPRKQAAGADLEARIADLERKLSRMQARSSQPEVARLAHWFYQADHGFSAGDLIVSDGTTWTAATFSVQPSYGCAGVVEKVVGDRFLVVMAGMVDATTWTSPPSILQDSPLLSFKPISENVYEVVQGPRRALSAVVFFDHFGGYIGKALVGGAAIDLAGNVTQIAFESYDVAGMDDGLPLVHGGIYEVVMETASTCRLTGYGLSGLAFAPRFATIASVTGGGEPATIKIYDPDTGEWWAKPSAAIGTWSSGITPTTATTLDEAEAATFPIEYLTGAEVTDRDYVVGDQIAVQHWCTTSFVLAHGLAELRDIDVSTAPEDYQALRWSAVTKKWGPGDLFPAGGTAGQVLTKTGSGMYDLEWADGGGTGGISSVTLDMLANQGIGFSDGSVGPKVGDTFTLAFLPVDSALAGADEVVKGTFMCAYGDDNSGALYPTNRMVFFPSATKRNALLVADATTALPKWLKAIEIGDTTNAGGSLKIWYAAGKYFELSAAGVITMYDSAGKQIVIDPATNGLKYTYATGKYVEISPTGKVTAYEAADKQFVIDMANTSIKATFPNSNTVELASGDFVGTSRAIKIREVDICDPSTGAMKKMNIIGSATY